MNPLYTIGHSTHSGEVFTALLREHGVTAVCDVRSSPYSRFNPQFNRETLSATLWEAGVAYVFMGRELGARRDDPACYVGGRVSYGLVAMTPLFQGGLRRVRRGLGRYRVALMCAEQDPLTCHRAVLVTRALRAPGVAVLHICADGLLEKNVDAEKRLLKLVGLPDETLFATRAELIEQAYDLQAQKIAYTAEQTAERGTERAAGQEAL